MAATALTISGLGLQSCKDSHVNPFLAAYDTPYEIPPFDQIRNSDYLPALDAGIAQKRAEIDSIVNNPEAPTFENTILALENSGEIFDRVTLVFGSLTEADTNDELNDIAETFMPRAQEFTDEVLLNDGLFQRIRTLYEAVDSLDLAPDQKRLITKYYKNFVNNGALLNEEDKEALANVNSQLAKLYLQFNKNLQNSRNLFCVQVSDSTRFGGLPKAIVDAAKAAAVERKLPDSVWAFTLDPSTRMAVLQYADDRDLRHDIYQGYTNLAATVNYNNRPVISNIINLRNQKARLLGYDCFGDYMTSKVMAKTPQAAEALLMQIWEPAKLKVAEEVAEMMAIADPDSLKFEINPWDYLYYAEKVRKQKYDLDEGAVSEYFPLENVRDGLFTLAGKLYGIKFTEMPDAPKYHPDVTVYDVTDEKTGEHIAVFMTDYYARPSKRQGAWMSEFKSTWQNPDGTWSRPIIYNVCNFAAPTADSPSLLTIDEVETAFHEFGHGLHGMLTRARYSGLAGTNVDRDFVELPSQLNEHWAFEPEMLRLYAKHYKTGETIPDELIEKINAAGKHGQGFATTELAGAALLDLAFGNITDAEDVDIDEFEAAVTARLGMPAELTYRYRPTYFKHAFGSEEYASGYYTYLWAEVLDSDGWELFKANGIFDPTTATIYKTNILEAGDTDEPMELYVRFRGQEPTVDALLRNRGLK